MGPNKKMLFASFHLPCEMDRMEKIQLGIVSSGETDDKCIDGNVNSEKIDRMKEECNTSLLMTRSHILWK